MKGNPDVLKALNEVLTAELTAINQYFIHAEMCENWGYERLYSRIKAEAMDEMRHADVIIGRILHLGGVPNMSRLFEIRVGKKVPDMLRNDLGLEREAIDRLNGAIATARKASDNGTAELFERILESEEKHEEWLDAQQSQIAQMGIENYLAQQVRSEG